MGRDLRLLKRGVFKTLGTNRWLSELASLVPYIVIFFTNNFTRWIELTPAPLFPQVRYFRRRRDLRLKKRGRKMRFTSRKWDILEGAGSTSRNNSFSMGRDLRLIKRGYFIYWGIRNGGESVPYVLLMILFIAVRNNFNIGKIN